MRKGVKLIPLFLVLLANLIGFGVLYFSGGQPDGDVLYYSIAVLALVLISYSVILFGNFGDEYLFLVVSMIFTIGIIFLYRINSNTARNQIIYFYIGMVGFFATYLFFKKQNFCQKLNVVVLLVGVSAFLYMITLLLGSRTGGAKNWINVGPVSIQASEIIKIFFILELAALYTMPYGKNMGFGYLGKMLSKPRTRQIVIMAVAYMNLGFLVLQTEWGSAVLYFLIYITMQYVFGKSKLVLGLNALLASGGALMGIKYVTHIQQRIDIWQDPFADSGNLGYQIVQSLYAMASGGFTGSGIGLGYPKIVPLVSNDFIFIAICEELGMIGGIGVIMLFFMLMYRAIKISLRAKTPYYKAVALGIGAMFGYQTFIIIGGVTKFIPMTGITLPFVSAGGSSLAACFIALAILQAISGKEGELSDVI